jgi:putative membrane protein
MNNRNSKIAIGIAGIFEIVLITTAIFNITSKQWSKFPLVLIASVCIILPFIITKIANKKNILLPHSFQLISVLFILLTLYFGEIKNFYKIFWWWDLFLHGLFGSYAIVIALHLIQGVIVKEKEVTKERFTIFTLIFAFSFSITLGTLWEMFEFLGDYLFKTDMVNGGLEDTASDLIIKIIAAFITSIICYYHKLNNQK